jgi:hypothetical protein
MAELRPPRAALSRRALAAALSLALATGLSPRGALADDAGPAACALFNGRIVSEGEVRETAASWSAAVVERHGAAAQAIARALEAELAPIDGESDWLIAFAAAGRVRVFALDHGCVRNWAVVRADQWERALSAEAAAPK